MKIRNSTWLPVWARVVLAFGCIATTHPVGAVEKVALHALFKDKAIVMVDGARRVLKAGDTSPEGVKLISTNTEQETAQIEVEGKPQELKLGTVISAFVSTGKGSATLYPDQGGHFFADGLINGVAVRFLVDTGATMVAMNVNTAKRIGLDYAKNGKPGMASTAGGVVRTYYMKLDSVQIGEIKVYGVDAGVVEGAGPSEVLLGMSFLGRMDMKRDGEKMELIQRY